MSSPTELALPSKRYTSWVWQHFRISAGEPKYAFCIVEKCKKPKVPRVDGNTSSLVHHLSQCHSIKQESSDRQQRSIRVVLKQQQIERCTKVEERQYNYAVALMFIDNCLPFHVIDSDSFINTFNTTSRRMYVPMGRSKLVSIVDDIYQDMIDTLMADMKDHSVSITTDSATLLNGRSYIAATGHYITQDWLLRDIVLAVDASDASHTAEMVSDLLDQVLHHWDINNRTFAAVTDNGANFCKAISINPNIEEGIRCGVHTLQLSLKDAAVENTCFGDLVDAARTLVSKIRSCQLLKSELREIQEDEGIKPHTLVADVSTRFNTVYLMFSRLLLLKQSITQLCIRNPDLHQLQLQSDQWTMMAEFTKVLEEVKKVSDTMEGSTSPTMSLSIALITLLKGRLDDLSKSLQLEPCKKMCTYVLDNITKRWKVMISNEVAKISMMLDPRIRTKKLPGFDKQKAIASVTAAYTGFEFSCYAGTDRSGSLLVASTAASSVSSSPSSSSSSSSSSDSSLVLPAAKKPRIMDVEEEAPVVIVSEITKFSQTPGIDIDSCPLEWWKTHSANFPVLSQMARVYLPVPASSASAERVFSTATVTLPHLRRRLDPDRVSRLVFMKRNMNVYKQIKASV